MKKLALVVLLSGGLIVPAQAEAATWKRCGNWSPDTGWTYGQIQGFGYLNVRALNVSCRTARRVARRSVRWRTDPRRNGAVVYGEGRYSEWICYLRFVPPEATRHRCRAPGLRRVRWTSAA
jgi:hypothetical protein